jgi:hypothetical protein
MSFDPEVGDKITLCGSVYTVEPRTPDSLRAYQQEGGKAIVYKLKHAGNGSMWAFKVFSFAYRGEHQASSVKRLEQLRGMAGLYAASQAVIPASDASVQEFPEFAWAVIMPWIEGQTWADILDDVAKRKKAYSKQEAISEATALARLFTSLELMGHVHCDISCGNVIRIPGSTPQYELIDLEDMRLSGASMPKNSTPGTPGYALPGVYTTAVSAGDRYAAAIVLMEALALGTNHAATLASMEGVFTANRDNEKDRKRFDDIIGQVNKWSPRLASLFRQAWNAASLEECPKIEQITTALESMAPGCDIPGEGGSRFDDPPPIGNTKVSGVPPPPGHGSGLGGDTPQPAPKPIPQPESQQQAPQPPQPANNLSFFEERIAFPTVYFFIYLAEAPIWVFLLAIVELIACVVNGVHLVLAIGLSVITSTACRAVTGPR